MAEQIQIQTPYGPTDALHWFLADRELMWSALKELMDEHGHRGAVVAWPDSQTEMVYRMETNDDAGNAAVGVLGDHLVLIEGDKLWAYTPDVYNILKHDEGEQ